MKIPFLKPKHSATYPAFDRKTTVWLVLMHAGCLAAPFMFSWDALAVCVILYWVTGGLGISLCFHRLLTHRSFSVPKPVEYLLTVFGCLAAQRSQFYWVARHRVHHAYADTENDPHTPRDGFLWSHMIWPAADLRVTDEAEYYKRYVPDLVRDPGQRWILKTHELWPLLLGAGLFLAGGLSWLIWGLCVRTVLVYHATWLVNSAAHIWGYKNYTTKDDSRNNALVALACFGEGWHNNHHAYPACARHGHRWWEFDISYLTIRVMALLGLAEGIRAEIPARQTRRKKAANAI